jgi:hypothetical protein
MAPSAAIAHQEVCEGLLALLKCARARTWCTPRRRPDPFTSVGRSRRAFVTWTRDANVACHHDHGHTRVDSSCAVSVRRSGRGYWG